MPDATPQTAAQYLDQWPIATTIGGEWFPYLIPGAGQAELLQLLEGRITHPYDPKQFFHAATFLSEACRLTPEIIKSGFRNAVRASSVIPALLKACDTDGSFASRHSTIHTLAMVSSGDVVPGFEAVLCNRRDTDPLLLPKLILEIGWLGGDSDRASHHVASSTQYLSCWSLLNNFLRGKPRGICRTVTR